MIRPAILLLCLGALMAVELAPAIASQAHDFGPTLPGTVCEHTFVFVNPGPGPWTVRKAVTSCACSVPHDLPRTVAAGGELPVPIRFNLGLRRDGKTSGEIGIILEREGSEGRLVCQFTATVASLLSLPQDRVRMEAMALRAGDPPTSGSIIVRRGPHPMAWDRLAAEVVTGSELISAQVTKIDDGSWQVTWTVSPGALCGAIPGRIDLSCWNQGVCLPPVERLVLPVRIQGAVRAEPDNLVFGAFPAGMSDVRQIRILDRQDQDAVVRACRVSDPARCQARQIAGAIELTFTAQLPAGPVPGWIDIDTTVGTVRLPYLAAVAAAESP